MALQSEYKMLYLMQKHTIEFQCPTIRGLKNWSVCMWLGSPIGVSIRMGLILTLSE